MKVTARVPLAAGILLAAQEQLRDAVMDVIGSCEVVAAMRGEREPVAAWVDLGGFDYDAVEDYDDDRAAPARVTISKGATLVEVARELEGQINTWLKQQAEGLTEEERRWLQGFYFAGDPPKSASF